MKKKPKMKTPITYYGGKQRLVSTILPLIPEHTRYVEPFVGGGAIFFAKEPSAVEIINDLSGDVSNFYTMCAREFGLLRTLILATPHSRKVHREAYHVLMNPDCFSEAKRAWAFWVQTNMSFGASIGKGWAMENKTNKTTKSMLNKRLNFTRELKNRLDGVQIESKDALGVIEQRDAADTFFYIDPPYFNSDCGHYAGYRKEDFVSLLELLSKLKGKFLLSSYPSDVLQGFAEAQGWHQDRKEQRVSVNAKGAYKGKIEMLTANYDLKAV